MNTEEIDLSDLNLNIEPLKAKTIIGFSEFLSEEAKKVYENIIPSPLPTDGLEPIANARYLQVTNKDISESEAIIKLAELFNKAIETDFFEGVLSLVGELDLKEGRKVFFVWPVLKEEYNHITKEDINKILAA